MREPLEDKKNNLVEDKKNAPINRKLPDSKQAMPPGIKWKRNNLSLILAMVLVSIFLVQLLDSQNPVEEKSYSEFKTLISDTSLAITSIELQRIGEGYILTGERKLTPEEQAKRKETHSAFSSRTVR